MAENVLSVAKGSKRAMTALCKENKNGVYALLKLLLNDETKAAELTKEVINKSWDRITVKDIRTDKGFERYLKCEAARLAAAEIFGGNLKNFRIAKVNGEAASVSEPTEYTGDAAEGVTKLSGILSDCDIYNRFVFLLKNAGGLSFIHIGQVIAQRETAARYFYENALTELKDKDVELSSVRSMYEKYIETVSAPADVDEACALAIKSRARFELPSKRAITAIVSIVCALFLALMSYVILDAAIEKSKLTSTSGDATSSEQSSETETGLDSYTGYVPPEIDTDKSYTAEITIKNYGTVKAELYPDTAPMTVANFVDLANKGFYDGLTFHRIMEGFMMQGGDPEGTGMGGSENTIFGEFESNGFTNNLKHEAGVLSMARSSDPNSASSQFFIMHDTASHLDGDYAAFGKVTEGMDIVNKICEESEPTDSNGTIPAEAQPIIESIKITVS